MVQRLVSLLILLSLSSAGAAEQAASSSPAHSHAGTHAHGAAGSRIQGSDAQVQPPAHGPAAFVATFDGTPDTAQPWRPIDWDVTIHSRDVATTLDAPEAVAAHHGANCAAPPTTHHVASYEDLVFVCNDHVMTSLNATDYGMLYFTPNHMVDFSEGEAVIRFDMSTLRTSQRDWIDLWITPYDDNSQLPLEDWLPDGQGEPRNAIHVRMDNAEDDTMFRVSVVRDFETYELEGDYWVGYGSFLTPDAKRRDTFELRLSQTHVAFGMPAYNHWWVDSAISDLGWSRGVVQFGHHSYNPLKDCATPCSPNTWHWDNVVIDPAVPFTIIRAKERAVDLNKAAAITFGQPAPADAHLRFAGYGENVEVSFDGDAWQTAHKQAQERNDTYHFFSYWTPIPEGTTSVRVRAEPITGIGHARDFSIFAPSQQGWTAQLPLISTTASAARSDASRGR